MYAPVQGRFLSRDPMPVDGVVVLYEHPFEYAGNNPVNNVDPSGLDYIDNFFEKVSCVCTFGVTTCKRAAELASEALALASTRYPGELHNLRGDAWRHCYWSCKLRQEFKPYQQRVMTNCCYVGRASPNACVWETRLIDPAAGILGAHERFGNDAGQPRIEFDMDTFNNSVGLSIGNNPNVNCSAECKKAIEDGRLRMINNNQLVPTNR